MNAAPCILAAACTFPSGTDIRLADAAVRTQLALLGRHPVYRDAAGAAPRISSFPDEQRYDAARWALLARHALAQLTQALLPQWDALQAAPRLLWLVVPDAERPGMPDGVAARIGEAMQHPLWPWQRITIVAGGHAAGIDALLAARQALTEAPGAMAVVLAAESGLAADALLWLDLQGLLHGAGAPGKAGTRGNPYGRVPGEGAAAVALAAAPPASGPGWARLLGCATAEEPATLASQRPCTGVGLAQAARSAIEQARAHGPARIGHLVADLNGEPHRADEFGFAAQRLAPALSEDWQRSAPALASGDLHDASAVAHLALAAYGQLRRPRSTHTLVLASSDGALRGAAVLGASRDIPDLPEIRPWRSPSTSTT